MTSGFKLHPYQQHIANHIIKNPRCAVWAGMGTGKTLATLTALKALKSTVGVDRVLVLAPLRVAQYTWGAEVKKWEHLSDLKVRQL